MPQVGFPETWKSVSTAKHGAQFSYELQILLIPYSTRFWLKKPYSTFQLSKMAVFVFSNFADDKK
jgi:hypothetical protein